MASGTDVQSLFLQVDASIELLRRNLASGDAPMAAFEQRAAKMANSVERSIGEMGRRFGPFAQLAQTAAQQAEKSFEDSFSQIQRMAAKAIQAPSVKGSGLNLGAAEAKQAADEARRTAIAMTEIERAARAAAAGEGVMTQETRMYLQAAAAARIEAQRHAAELTREAGALERLEIETRVAAAGQRLLAASSQRAGASAGMQRQSTMMLGQQVQDFSVQVMSGQSAMVAFSQQIGQAAFAIQGMGGRMAAVGAFLASGWGAAVTVGAVVLVPLIGKIMEHSNALETAVGKLKKEAEQTALNDRAHMAFSHTIEGQIDAQKRLNDELDRSIRTQRQEQELTLARARSTLQDNRNSVPRQQAEIVKLEQIRATAAGNVGLAAGVRSIDIKLEAAREKLRKTQASIVAGERAVREAEMPLISSDVEASLDRRTAATMRYETAVGRLRRALAIGAGNQGRELVDEKTGREYGAKLSGISSDEYRRQLASITKQRDDAYKAIQSDSSGTRSNKQVFADFQAELAKRGIQQAAGRTGYRSTADQREIFKSGESPLDGVNRVSRHQSWQALDPTRNSHNDAAAQEAAQAAGLKGFRIVTESGGRKHYEWKGAGKRGDVDVAGSEALERRTEAARQAVLSDEISFAEQSRQYRRRLLDAQGHSAGTEEERDRLAREEVEADFEARKKKIGAQLSKGDLKPEEAKTLNKSNEDTRDQLLRNIQIDRAKETITAGFDDRGQSRQQQMAMLRIREDMAVTERDRRDIQRQLLELEQEERRQALERIRQTSDDPRAVLRATNGLKELPATDEAEKAALARRQAGPMAQYREQLHGTVDDINGALESVETRGFQSVENGFAGILTGTVTVGGAFKRMSNEIIADLARIAAQKLLLSILPTGGGSILSMFGLSGGGKVEGKAGGGKISGPGTGTSDSVWAMLGTKPIMLSNGESIVTAEATAKFWPVIDAMNKGRVKGLAQGGMVSGLPTMPSAPRLPSMARYGGGSGAQRDALSVKVEPSPYFSVEVQRIAAPMAQAAVIGGSGMAQQEIAERQSQALS